MDASEVVTQSDSFHSYVVLSSTKASNAHVRPFQKTQGRPANNWQAAQWIDILFGAVGMVLKQHLGVYRGCSRGWQSLFTLPSAYYHVCVGILSCTLLRVKGHLVQLGLM